MPVGYFVFMIIDSYQYIYIFYTVMSAWCIQYQSFLEHIKVKAISSAP